MSSFIMSKLFSFLTYLVVFVCKWEWEVVAESLQLFCIHQRKVAHVSSNLPGKSRY